MKKKINITILFIGIIFILAPATLFYKPVGKMFGYTYNLVEPESHKELVRIKVSIIQLNDAKHELILRSETIKSGTGYHVGYLISDIEKSIREKEKTAKEIEGTKEMREYMPARNRNSKLDMYAAVTFLFGLVIILSHIIGPAQDIRTPYTGVSWGD